DSLEQLVRDRIAQLPPESSRSLLVVASLSDPALEVVESALEGDPKGSLSPALEAGVLEVEGDRVRFTHPLLASTVCGSADPLERREVHRVLAELVPSVEERARHLSLGARGPSAEVGAELRAGARAALLRG